MERLKWWQVLIGVGVAIGVGVVGSIVVSVALAVALAIVQGAGTEPSQLTSATMEQVQAFPVIATSLVVTGMGLAFGAFLPPLLARLPARETLGLRSAPVGAFVAASIGIVSLAPTSDWIVRAMQRIAPSFTLGALDQLATLTRTHSFFVLFPLIAIIPGFCEELLFRGLVQRSLGRGGLAISVSALSFSVFHLDPHHVAGVVPLGFFLAWAAARTNSTWVTIAAHVTNNTVALAASQLAGTGAATSEEPAPLWVVAVGWVITAACVAVIARLSPKQVPEAPPPPATHVLE